MPFFIATAMKTADLTTDQVGLAKARLVSWRYPVLIPYSDPLMVFI
jgi:hypothetical protein